MLRFQHLNLLALLLLPAMVLALPGPGQRPALGGGPLIKVQNTQISARVAARVVRQATGGRVLAVNRIQTNQGPAYRVKVLTRDGRIRIMLVDAASGTLR